MNLARKELWDKYPQFKNDEIKKRKVVGIWP